MSISALILTKNEEEMIEDCLKQLDFADEIIVLDEDSEDSTVQLAKKYTKLVFKSPVSGFDKNRSLLANMAKSKWLLYVDADERLTKELTSEIKQAIKDPRFSAYLGPQSEPSRTRTAECSAFYFPRRNIILGKWLKHGGWWPDYVPRLFKKDKLKEWQGQVHESPQVDGKFGYLKFPLEHITAKNLSEMLTKSTVWGQIEAELYYRNHHPKVTSLKIIKAMTFEFIGRFFLKMGFLDGVVGLIEAVYQSTHQAIVLTYLWEIQNNVKQRYQDFNTQ